LSQSSHGQPYLQNTISEPYSPVPIHPYGGPDPIRDCLLKPQAASERQPQGMLPSMPKTKPISLQVRWVGPLPRVGEFLCRELSEGRQTVIKLERVLRRVDLHRVPRLTLVGPRVRPDNVPPEAIVHTLRVQRTPHAPGAAASPVLVGGPGPEALIAVRQARHKAEAELKERLARITADAREQVDAGVSPATKLVPSIQRKTGKVERDEWRDPDADNSRRRTPKMAAGFRRADPLRVLQKRNSLITEEHLKASEQYRSIYEAGPGGARRGYEHMTPRFGTPGPADGPGEAQLAATRKFMRIQERFDEQGRSILFHVVLGGRTVTTWAVRNDWDPKWAVGYLIAQLNDLAKILGFSKRRPTDE
jgi:hypothetical protein